MFWIIEKRDYFATEIIKNRLRNSYFTLYQRVFSSLLKTALSYRFIYFYLLLLVENYHNPLEDESFEQLVLLFGEIIRNDVFSHNDYMCLLISRGDIGCSSLLDTPVYFEDSKSRTESPSGMPVSGYIAVQK